MFIPGFLADVASGFRNHYLRLANDILGSRTPEHYYGTERLGWPYQSNQPTVPEPVDRYEPSTPPLSSADTESPDNLPTDRLELSGAEEPPPVPVTGDEPAAEETPAAPIDNDDVETEPAPVKPDETYFFKRAARLDYKLNLRFDLAAISQTVRFLSEGDTESVEQLAAAGFGLHTDFALKGHQWVETNQPELMAEHPAGPAANSLNLVRSRQAGLFRANSRDFAVEAFYRQAAKVRRNHHVLTKDGYTQAVNKFAMRFRMDSRFSFAHLSRFNVQTQEVAERLPESLEQYVASAGNVAQSGTNEMMATFFDAVDGYLEHAEEQLLDRLVTAFDAAAEELGFSGGLVDSARDNLVSTIESFFDRVDESLAGMRSQFIPDELVQPLQPSGEPEIMPAQPADPGVAEETQQLAYA